MEGADIKLIIKAPNQQIKDQVISCNIGWTVGRLKKHLTEVYPSKPEASNQKLIYSGQLLNDSAHLKDVLRQTNGTEDQAYIIHLVCAPQKNSMNKATTEPIKETINTNLMSTMRGASENVRANNVRNQNQDSGNVTTPSSHTQLYSAQQYLDPRNSQQMAWMQQAYTHYFMQYMQFMAAQGMQLQPGIHYMPQMNINPNDAIYNTYVNNNNNNVGDEQPQPLALEAANNNGAIEDGAFNRDWLDFVYMTFKTIIFFGVVYFYSSPLRFLIVTFLGFLIYLYQGGFFRVQPALLFENNNGQGDNNNQVLQNEEHGQAAAQQQNEQTPAVQSGTRMDVEAENEEERPGALGFTWTFFSSFFASLIPDQPNVL